MSADQRRSKNKAGIGAHLRRCPLQALCLAALCLAARPAAAQETQGQATLSLQGYYLGATGQPVSDLSGASFEFRQFFPDVGLMSGSLAPYAGQGRFRTADNYLELRGFSWQGMHWTFRGGDFFLPTNLVEFPFTNIYYPLLSARGGEIQAATSSRELGFFAGAETVQAGPRVPFRLPVPQTALGGWVKQKFGSHVQIGARFLRLTSSMDAILKNPFFFPVNRSFEKVDTAAVQSLVSVSHLRFFAEASSSFYDAASLPLGGRQVPLSGVAGPAWETDMFGFRANYIYQSASYLPMAGYFVGDRKGPYAEARFRPVKWLEVFGSVNRYSNNLEGSPDVASFKSTGITEGLSLRLPARFTVSGQLSTVRLASMQPDSGTRLDAQNRLWSASLSRPIRRHTLRLTARDIKILNGSIRDEQKTAEAEDIFQYKRFVMGAAIRAERMSGDQPKNTISGRGSLQVRLGPLTAHGYFEGGNDLANRTLFATTAFSSSVAGVSARLSKTWSLDAEYFRNHLLTELNPQNLFILQNQGTFESGVLSTLGQWSFYFRLSKQFAWGQPIPTGNNIYQFTASQIPLVGAIEGIVWQQGMDGRRPAQGVPVRLDESRTVATQADGHFRFEDVAEGQHKVALAAAELPADYDPGILRATMAIVQPKRTARADLEVIRLTGIQGSVIAPKESPLDSILIRLLPTDRYTTPDADGNFFFQNLREGDYQVALDEKTLPAQAVLLSPARVPVSVRVGQEMAPLRFQFEIKALEKPVRKIF